MAALLLVVALVPALPPCRRVRLPQFAVRVVAVLFLDQSRGHAHQWQGNPRPLLVDVDLIPGRDPRHQSRRRPRQAVAASAPCLGLARVLLWRVVQRQSVADQHRGLALDPLPDLAHLRALGHLRGLVDG